MKDVWERERDKLEHIEKPMDDNHCLQSIAISLKRIADTLEQIEMNTRQNKAE